MASRSPSCSDPDEKPLEPIGVEAQADYLLESLARNSRDVIARLGFPRESAEQRENKGGSAHAATLSDEDAKSDKALAVLKRGHKSVHFEVIDRRYFRVEPIEALMRRFRVKQRAAYNLVKRAQVAFWRVREALPSA